jgi:hypothetical protein
MRMPFLISITLIVVGCHQTDKNPKTSSSVTSSMQTIIEDSLDFCKACDDLQESIGGIQGVETSDSTGIYPMGDCYTNLNYDLLWVPKGDILKFKANKDNIELIAIYDSARKNNYRDFNCYAFEIPKTKPKEEYGVNGISDYDYVFPSKVKVYKKVERGWQLLTTKNVNSFEELSQLKVNTIFKIN